ncbi:MAG: hypothetical protein VYD11_06035 [Actinomycetota bacterium]|nr:hypothetical protein [Actinomycetota bacterium]MEE2958510.1 hypothetical protein [Actinomycetota bacterium]
MSHGMNQAELSSITAQLADLAQRVEELASTPDGGERADDRSGLLEVERHLRAALRELDRTRRS